MQADNEAIIDSICDYAERHHIKELLQEYLKRVVMARPSDPVSFLIKSITDNPLNFEEPEEWMTYRKKGCRINVKSWDSIYIYQPRCIDWIARWMRGEWGYRKTFQRFATLARCCSSKAFFSQRRLDLCQQRRDGFLNLMRSEILESGSHEV